MCALWRHLVSACEVKARSIGRWQYLGAVCFWHATTTRFSPKAVAFGLNLVPEWQSCHWLLSCVTDCCEVDRSVLSTINEDVLLCYIHNGDTVVTFKRELKTFLFNQAFAISNRIPAPTNNTCYIWRVISFISLTYLLTHSLTSRADWIFNMCLFGIFHRRKGLNLCI